MARNLILTTATEYIMGWIEIYFHSLTTYNRREEFDLVILTFPGAFSARAKSYLEKKKIRIFEHTLDEIQVSKFNAYFAENIDVYRLKHLGKAYLACEYLQSVNSKGYDYAFLSDLDIIFQSTLNELTSLIEDGKICAAQEYRPLSECPFLERKLKRALRLKTFNGLDFDLKRHEINYGFLWSDMAVIENFCEAFLEFVRVKELQSLLDAETGNLHGYHEQDYLRLYLQCQDYQNMKLVDEDILIHLCNRNSGKKSFQIEYITENQNFNLKFPKVVHFAGGVYDAFPEIGLYLNAYIYPEMGPCIHDYLDSWRIGIDLSNNCVQIMQDESNQNRILFHSAIQLKKRGSYDDAMEMLCRVIESKPEREDIHYQIVLILLEMGNVSAGLDYLDENCPTIKRHINIRKTIAGLLERHGHLSSALSMWEKLRELYPFHCDWLQPMVRLLSQTGNTSAAKELLDWYRKYASYRLPVLQEGQCLKMIGGLSEALQLYNETLLKWPEWIELMVETGHLYKQTGEIEKGIAIFEKVLALAPGNKDVLVQLLHSLTILRRHSDARTRLAQETDTKSLSYHQHGLCLKNMGELEEALIQFKRGTKVENDNTYACLWQTAEILTDLSRFEEAIEVYENALKINPTDYSAQIRKIFLLAKTDNREKGLSELSHLRDQHPESVQTLPYEFGRCLDALEMYEDALSILARVPVDDINYYDALNLMGCAQAALKNYDAALSSFKSVVAACPDRQDVWLRISDVYRYLQRYDDALQIIDQVADSSQDPQMLNEKKNKILKMIPQL